MTANLVSPPVTSTGTAPTVRGRVRPGHLVTGLVLLTAAVTAAVVLGTGVSSVLVFMVLPDVALLIGLGGSHLPGQLPRKAVPAYNLLHSPAVPALLLVAAVAWASAYWVVAATTWGAHIALDRGLGYGLRTADGWQRG